MLSKSLEGVVLKACRTCCIEKSTDAFWSHRGKKDGYSSSCKTCSKEKEKEKYVKHKDKIKVRQAIAYKQNIEENRRKRREDYLKNTDKYKERSRKQRIEKKEEVSLYKKEWSKKNRYKKNASEGKRRAIQIQACPSWLSKDDVKLIESTYAMARWLTLTCFQNYHVDHIIPLNNSKVCGLHVPWNLQILSATDNMSKGNRLENQ